MPTKTVRNVNELLENVQASKNEVLVNTVGGFTYRGVIVSLEYVGYVLLQYSKGNAPKGINDLVLIDRNRIDSIIGL